MNSYGADRQQKVFSSDLSGQEDEGCDKATESLLDFCRSFEAVYIITLIVL